MSDVRNEVRRRYERLLQAVTRVSSLRIAEDDKSVAVPVADFIELREAANAVLAGPEPRWSSR